MRTTTEPGSSAFGIPPRPAVGAGRWPRWLLDAAPALAFGAVFLVAGVILLTTLWRPTADLAVAEIVIRNAVRHPPLFGPYSATRGFHHPLPWVYALLWLPYSLSGQRSSAQLMASVWWNGGGIALVLWLTARRSVMWLGVAIVAAIALFARSTNLAVLMMPWNPYLAFIPCVVLIVVVWRICLGSYRLLALAAALAMWCAGAHIGFIPLVAVLSLVAGVVSVVRVTRAEGRGGLRRLVWPLALSAAVVLVMALPAIVDLALHGSNSNPVALWRYFRHPIGPRLTHGIPVKALFDDLSLPPSWITGAFPTGQVFVSAPYRTPVLLVPVVAAIVAAWRRRATEELAGLGLSLLALGVAFGALYDVHGASAMVSWFLLPMRAAIMCLAGFTVWSIGRSVSDFVTWWASRRITLAGPSGTGAATVVAATFALLILPSFRISGPDRATARAANAVAREVERHVSKSRPVLLSGDFAFDSYDPQALALDLSRAGYAVHFPPQYAYIFGTALATPPAGTVTRLQVSRLFPDRRPRAPTGAQRLADVSLVGAYFAGPGTRLVVWRLP